MTYDGATLGEYSYYSAGAVWTVLAEPLTGEETTLGGGWYVATGDFTYSNDISVTGNVSNPTCLILADGVTINTKDITGDGTGSTVFKIYQQSADGTAATVTVDGSISNMKSLDVYGGDLTVGGGIAVRGASFYAGEHTVSNASGHAIACTSRFTMNGGKLTATGGGSGCSRVRSEGSTHCYRRWTDSRTDWRNGWKCWQARCRRMRNR